MIIYRKGGPLRIRRMAVPEPPYWCATSIAPYSARRGAPVAIDYIDLRASYSERMEVSVAENVTDELERGTSRLTAPVFIEASEFAEAVFGRGGEALGVCQRLGLPAMHLVSTRGDVPERLGDGASLIIAAWPLDLTRLERLFAAAGEQRAAWGVAVPVIFPVTTSLTALEQLAGIAKEHGARCLASLPMEIDATAKQAIASSLSPDGDQETFQMLFHANLEPLHVATERHIAALAAANEMCDFIAPPDWNAQTNWNAAVLLTLTATRMMAMEREIELAGTMARSARIVAGLDKPLARIAEAASLSIIEALDEISVDILSDWLAGGRSPYVERVNEEWRLRRDAGL